MNKRQKRYVAPKAEEVRVAGRGIVCMERFNGLVASANAEVYSKRRGHIEADEAEEETASEIIW